MAYRCLPFALWFGTPTLENYMRFLISDTNLPKPLSRRPAFECLALVAFELLTLPLPFYGGSACSPAPVPILMSSTLSAGLSSNRTRALEVMVDFFLYDEVCYLSIYINNMKLKYKNVLF